MIDIKDIQGNILASVPITQSCQKVEELMVNDYIQLSWNSDTRETLPVGSYIEYNGERYSLIEPYSPSQKNETEFVYTPQFKSRVMAWSKKPFFFYSGESKEPDWTLTSNPADFMRCVCDAISNETGETWSYSIDASLPASASLSFSSSDILSGLNQIAGAFETEWFADKSTNTLYLGLLSHGEEVTLKVGENINVPSVQGNKEGYYTRFYAFGSTRNIAQDYEGSNTNNLVNKRLTLDPIKYPNGYKDIREGLSEGEIFSKVLIFDEVYPSANLSISGVRNRLMYRLDSDGKKIQLGTDESGNPIYDQYAIWYFRIEGFDFDVSNIIEGYKLSVSFQSGSLQGREFELKYYEKDTTITTSDGVVFEAKAGDYEILFVEEGSYIIPSMTGLVPTDGDSVVLFNIKMPSEYTQSAYDKLEEELDKAISRINSDLNNYTFKSNPVAFNDNNPNLSIGRNVKYVNGSYSFNTRVIKLITHLDFPIEQEITIGNEKVKGNTQQLKEEVASANKDLNLLAVFNDMTQSLQQSYNRTQQMMLDGFAAIKNIWQLKTDSNGKTYAFSAFDVVTQYGITMYADGEDLDLPSIYAGIPFDNKTIWLNPETGYVEVLGGTGGGSGEGVSNFWDLSNIPSWITATKPTYSYSEIDGTPDLSVYALSSDLESLQTKIDDFLEGSDTDTIINKWLELESFLSGLTETDNLATILGSKADKATTLAGYGITDAYTKSAINTLLGDYVTLATAQTITGEKDFTGGLKVNGSPIVYDATNKYWKLEGDLLVTGGVTMYGNDSEFVASTIMDALLLDDATLGINSEGQLYVKGGTGGGLTEVYWDDVKEKPTFATVATSGKYSDLSGVPTLLSSFTDDVVAGKYLPLSGGTINAGGNWTELNIQSTSNNLKFISYGSESYIQTDGTNSDVLRLTGANGASGYLLNMLFDNITVGGGYPILHSNNYSSYALPLSGGTLTGSLNLPLGVGHKIGSDLALWVTSNAPSVLQLRASSSNKGGQLAFYWDTSWKGTLAATTDSVLIWNDNTIWHAGNDGSGSGLDADLLDGVQSNMFHKELRGSIASSSLDTYATRDGGNYAVVHDGYSGMLVHFTCNNLGSVSALDLYVPHYSFTSYGLKARTSVDTSYYTAWRTFAFTDSNVASATKLQTARTIWGQSFDGTGNVDGKIKLTDWDSDGVAIRFENTGKTSAYLSFYSAASNAYTVGQNGSRFLIAHNTYGDIFNVLNGNVLIGTTTDGGYKLDVNGNIRCGQVYYSDNFRYLAVGIGSDNAHYANFGEYNKAYYTAINLNANGATRFLGADGTVKVLVDHSTGSVGIGTASPTLKLDVAGSIRCFGSNASLNISTIGASAGASLNFVYSSTDMWQLSARFYKGMTNENDRMNLYYYNGTTWNKTIEVTTAGNVTVLGGITMYSDIRKKTKLQDVELSLKQIADAPLIEHYYNSDTQKTTHVGSIAQYWAGLNDWFCKLDNEGYYTMEIQNAALASAISIARELVKYESKTDRTIRKLKQRVSELEEEMEKLKSA